MIRLILNIFMIASGMVGSILIAMNVGIGKWGYVLFLVNSSTSVLLLKGDKHQRGLFIQSIFYMCVNIFGLLRWFHIL